MTRVFSGLADAAPPDPAPQSPLASWYTPGLSDALGDRLLMFDNTTASPLELLRFKPELSKAPEFEAALRERVEELASFDHPGLASVRAVKWLAEGDGLTLISNQIVGRRLSDLLGQIQGTALAVELIRQLCPVLAALHERGIAHGIVTPERIIITPDGRVMLSEHVLASALDKLKLPTAWMRTQLGLAVPSGNGRIELDGRSDIVQLGFIALSIASGQRLDAAAYPDKVGQILGDGAASGMPPGLRRWLERSLHLVWPPFASALEATAALDELPEHREPPNATPQRPARTETPRLPESRAGSNVIAIRPNPRSARPESPKPPSSPAPIETVEPPSAPFFPDETQLPPSPRPAVKPVVTVERRPDPVPERPPDAEPQTRPKRRTDPPAATAFSPEMLRAAFGDEMAAAPAPARSSLFRSKGFLAAVITVALLEAGIIAGLLLTRPASTPADLAGTPSTPAAATVSQVTTPPPPAPEPQPSNSRRTRTPDATSATPAAVDTGAPARPAPAAQRTGTVRFSSPVVLEVHANGARLGTTANPIALAAGRHTLELINESLGYRAAQSLTIAAGSTVSRTITLPQGRLNINALPWATVSVDGKPVGETPLANLAVPIGPHEVTFRHPMLGEKRETTVVKAEGVTRVSVNMQR